MGKRKIIFLAAVVLAACLVLWVAFSREPEDVVPQIVDDHDETIGIVDSLLSKGKLEKTPVTIINFDYHADLYRNNQHIDGGHIDEGNWINVLISKGIVDEVCWILPDESKNIKELNDYYWEGNDSLVSKEFFRSGSPMQTFLVNKKTGRMHYDESLSGTEYAEVKFYKMILSDIGNIESKNEKQVILSMDADFFIGNDEGVPKPADQNQVRKRFDEFNALVGKLNLSPKLTVCSRSKEYVYEEYLEEFEKFCIQSAWEEIGNQFFLNK